MTNSGRTPFVPAERRTAARPAPGGIDRRSFVCVGEPPLSELLSDPIIRRLMSSDAVTTDHLCALITAARARVAT